jgi:hypothetical protein
MVNNPNHWSASNREPPRSTIGIAAVQTAIEYEYEYRFTEYRPPRRTEYEYDEIRCAARTLGFRERRLRKRSNGDPRYSRFATIHCSSFLAYLSASQGHTTRTAVRQASWRILQEVIEAGSRYYLCSTHFQYARAFHC